MLSAASRRQADRTAMDRVRPTLRCLREDLDIPVGPVDRPLDEIDHPLIAKAQEQFADPRTPHERIAAVDDQVLFKVKVGRWRGAIWPGPPATEDPSWTPPPQRSSSTRRAVRWRCATCAVRRSRRVARIAAADCQAQRARSGKGPPERHASANQCRSMEARMSSNSN
jgi:hypothetical protein